MSTQNFSSSKPVSAANAAALQTISIGRSQIYAKEIAITLSLRTEQCLGLRALENWENEGGTASKAESTDRP